jgi:hypothetical protein
VVKIRSLVLLAIVVFAGCQGIGTPPPAGTFAWCYLFDFTQTPYTLSIPFGTWTQGVGITSDPNNQLSFGYTQAGYTSATRVRYFAITARRETNTLTNLNLTYNGAVFGIDFVGQAEIPIGTNGGTLPFNRQPANENYFGTMNLAVTSSEPVVIMNIRVYGDGVNPFPEDSCAQLTSTPTNTLPPTSTPIFSLPTETPQPTFTPSPTLTPLPTETTIPTWTPQPTLGSPWCWRWNFADGSGSWQINPNLPYGSYSSGNGWQGQGALNGIVLYMMRSIPTASQITRVEVNFDAYSNNNGGGNNGAFSHQSSTLISWGSGAYRNGNFTLTWNGSITTAADQYFYWSQGNGSGSGNGTGGNFLVKYIELRGYGANLYGENNCTLPPTLTPSPTITPSLTRTPTNTPTPPPTFTPSPTRTWTPSGSTWTPLPGGGATATRTPLSANTRTPAPGGTVNPSLTPITTTPIPPPTLLPSPTVYLTYVWQTATSSALTNTAPTWTPATGAPTIVATGTPIPDWSAENEAEWNILGAMGSFFNWVGNVVGAFFDFIAQLIRWIIGTVNNILIALSNLFNALIGYLRNNIGWVNEALEIGRMIGEIILRIAQLLIGWIGQVFAQLSILLNSFYNAPLIPLPGMPLCISAPTQYEVCALYYILENTLFASGTPGAVIPIFLVTLMDIWILFYFVRRILKVVRRGEKVTNVG